MNILVWFLKKVAVVYSLALFVGIMIAFFMVVSQVIYGPESFSNIITVIVNGIGAVFEKAFMVIMLPAYEYVLEIAKWAMGPASRTSAAMGIFSLVVLLACAATLFAITLYIPLNLVIMPLWAIFGREEHVFNIWAIFLDPLQIINGVGMPLVDSVNNMYMMTNSDPALAQRAANKDLAEQLKK